MQTSESLLPQAPAVSSSGTNPGTESHARRHTWSACHHWTSAWGERGCKYPPGWRAHRAGGAHALQRRRPLYCPRPPPRRAHGGASTGLLHDDPPWATSRWPLLQTRFHQRPLAASSAYGEMEQNQTPLRSGRCAREQGLLGGPRCPHKE